MRKILITLALSFLLVQSSLAADSLLKSDHPDSYLVKKGDTLWDISSMFLTDAWRWPEIWEVNPDIDNPHLIFPGDEIFLRYVDGKPQLSLNRGDEGRTVRLNPDTRLSPQVRIEPLASAIPAIALDKIASLLNSGRIVDKNTLERAPHILAGRSERLVFGPGDEFYARGDWDSETLIYGVFREGDVYKDPDTGDILGYEAQKVGVAAVKARNKDVYSMTVKSINKEIRIGDSLLPTEEQRVESVFYPAAPDSKVEGVVMTIIDGATIVGKNHVVALNRGSRNGLAVGNVLAIHKSGLVIRDPVDGKRVSLPEERVGLLMVFRVFDRMSYGLILQAEEEVNVGDMLRNP